MSDYQYNPRNSTVLMPVCDFGEVYADLVETLLSSGPEFVDTEINQRTGSEIKALVGATSFKLDLGDGLVPMPRFRRFHLKTAAAEVAWFLMGTKDVSWLRKYAPIWDKFTEDDGKTIDAAYGYRWKHQFGRDQLKHAMEALHLNPSDRRVYVSNWDPSEDGLGAAGQKNAPCPLGFTLSIVDQKLHSTLTLRSSDVFVGLPYDVAGHAILMQAIASSIEGITGLGTMTVTLAHPHLYKTHYAMAREMLGQDPVDPVLGSPKMLDWATWEILEGPDGFVQAYGDQMDGLEVQAFNPRPEVVQ